MYFSSLLTLAIVYAHRSQPVQWSRRSCSLAKSIYNNICVCAPEQVVAWRFSTLEYIYVCLSELGVHSHSVVCVSE